MLLIISRSIWYNGAKHGYVKGIRALPREGGTLLEVIPLYIKGAVAKLKMAECVSLYLGMSSILIISSRHQPPYRSLLSGLSETDLVLGDPDETIIIEADDPREDKGLTCKQLSLSFPHLQHFIHH